MDIAALKAFVAVAESGSFSRAAETVFLTQPAISKRIAALEAELGTNLFDRIGRKVQLTEAGKALLGRAHTILIEVEDARRSITNLSGEISGTLAMAASHHIGLHRLPNGLKAYNQRYPDVQLDLKFMDSEGACAAIEHGDLELGVVTLPEHAAPELRTIKTWDDPLEIVVGVDHPLAKEKTIKPITLLNYPAILPGPGTITRELILSALASVRDGIDIGMATNYMEVLKMLAAIGLGWSALPHTLIDENLHILKVEGVKIERQLGIVLHRERSLSNAARAMMDIIEETK
ncbi:MAG: LysR family transcriptional regulator [Acidiferrobacterales bacterium]